MTSPAIDLLPLGNKDGPQIPHHSGRFGFFRGSGGPQGNPGARRLGRSEEVGKKQPLYAGLSGPLRQFPGPQGLPSCAALPLPLQEVALLALLSSNPDRVREAKCLFGTLASRRAAGTGREDPQPDKSPFRFCLL